MTCYFDKRMAKGWLGRSCVMIGYMPVYYGYREKTNTIPWFGPKNFFKLNGSWIICLEFGLELIKT